MGEAFRSAMRELAELKGADRDVTSPVLRAVPNVTGASVATLGGILEMETISASDRTAQRLDDLQFDLGEGPCWDAVALGRPIIEPDLQHHPRRAWPALAGALREDPVGSLFAFPLAIGGVRFGALDLYHDRPSVLSDRSTEHVVAMVELISRHVLQRALRLAGEFEESGETRHSRRIVHQATGFVIAQLDVSPEDAHLLIQGQALSQGRSMSEIAEDIVARRLAFTMQGDRIEEET